MREIQNKYEKDDIYWNSDNEGLSHRCFYDTDLTSTDDNLITERKMVIDGKTFVVCSVFPQAPKTTATDKMMKIIGKDLEK